MTCVQQRLTQAEQRGDSDPGAMIANPAAASLQPAAVVDRRHAVVQQLTHLRDGQRTFFGTDEITLGDPSPAATVLGSQRRQLQGTGGSTGPSRLMAQR